MAKKFTGEGFSVAPLDGEEAARHRHMFQIIDDQFIDLGGVVTLIRAWRIFVVILRTGAIVGGAMYALGVYAKSQGLL